MSIVSGVVKGWDYRCIFPFVSNKAGLVVPGAVADTTMVTAVWILCQDVFKMQRAIFLIAHGL